MTREDLALILAPLSAVFRSELSDLALEGYWLALKDMQREDVAHAAERALKECERMPPPATFRKLAPRRWIGAIPGAKETRAQLEAASTCTYHRSIPDRRSPEPVDWCVVCDRARRGALPGYRPSIALKALEGKNQ